MAGSEMRLVAQLLLVILSCISATSAFVSPAEFRHHVTPPRSLSSNRVLQLNRFSAVTSLGSASATSDLFDSGNHHLAKPRLVSALETTIRWTMKYLLLRQISSLTISIDASSNRALLQGKLNNLSLSARDCIFRFNLLSLKRWDVNGANLRLGYVPFILPCLPWIIWRLRRYIWLTLFSIQLLRTAGYLKLGSIQQMAQTIKERMYYALGARSSTISYSFSVGEENIGQSFVLRFWLQRILRSLVENSVVGAAAAFGDAFNAERKRERNQARQIGAPLLPSNRKGSEGGGTDFTNALRRSAVSGNDSASESRQQGLTSTLLSATSFKLLDTSFSKGRVTLQAEAVMPKDENNLSVGQALPFTIRAKLEPTSLPNGEAEQWQQQQHNNAIGFFSPECRLNTNSLTAGTFLGKLIPDVVWIPFGAGVAVPLGTVCRLYRAEATDGKGGNDPGTFRIDGSLDLLPERKGNNDDSSLIRY